MDFLAGIRGQDFVMLCSDTSAVHSIVTMKQVGLSFHPRFGPISPTPGLNPTAQPSPSPATPGKLTTIYTLISRRTRTRSSR